MMQTHYPHPYDPQFKPEILRQWTERRKTKCPIPAGAKFDRWYTGTFISYNFINKKKKLTFVEEFCIKVVWDNV